MSIELPLFLIRVATVTFFSIGFIAFFQRIWYDAFENQHTQRIGRIWRRVMLLAISVGMGLFIHYGAMTFIHNNSAILYHNWALFVLTLPLLFGGFRWYEMALEGGAILIVWQMHHAPNFYAPTTLTAMLVFAGVLVLIKLGREQIMKRWWTGVAAAFVAASLFWFTVPPVSMGMHVPLKLAVQAVLLYTLMLAFVLGYWLRQQRLDRKQRQLERLADYEKGTSANTYAQQQKSLQALFTKIKQQGGVLSFATLDLDHFKQVNDRFGHLAGNAVLIEVTDTLNQILNDAKVPHQLYLAAGEEYNLIFPNRTPESVMPLIKACWQGIRKRDFTYEDRSIDVTLSIGMTALHPDDRSINNIYQRADDALAKAKRSGRDTITFDQQIVSGIDRNEKRLADYRYFAQGVYAVDAPDHPKDYHELLLRTYDPQLKRWILPDSFELPIWMSIALMQDFMKHDPLHRFNLNLTADQFQDLEIADALTQFAESPEGPEALTVEIMDLTDSQTTRRISSVYRAAGIKLYIDDVGSDNSFEVVRSCLPYINGIKFAMQNLRKTTTDEQLTERVKFWRQIASENDLRFILEGVETKQDLAMAESLKIDHVQGYYFDKPSDPHHD